jgi:hypothetical protein
MNKSIYILILSFLALKSFSQSAEIRPNQGISVPQFTTVFINAMTTQPKGTVVFDKDLNTMKYWTGTVWQSMSAGAGTGWTATGSDIANSNIGNVGIGASSPSEAKLVVNSPSSTYTNAVFGSNGTGISLQKNYPTIGFNQYRDLANVQRYIGTGYAMGNYLDPITGDMNWFSIPSGTAGAPVTTYNTILKLKNSGSLAPILLETPSSGLSMFGGNDISPIVSNNSSDGSLKISSYGGIPSSSSQEVLIDGSSIQSRGGSFSGGIGGFFIKSESNLRLNPFGGRVGINSGNATLSANLDVHRSPGNHAGTAVFRGTNHTSHFNYSTAEDTYIRSGKDGSKVIINDIPNGYIELAGKVTVNQDLSAPQTGGLNLVPLGIFSYN